ncbi:hypothetical protein [Ureaplasma canigenitalium]|uniref:hypothetical protein n=1 Tax=Ureaplasma canigenitalium TaxID=42092 RepID=UPI0004E1FD61|nr:hypothetical protein [Ureaplasma canigenitalium]
MNNYKGTNNSFTNTEQPIESGNGSQGGVKLSKRAKIWLIIGIILSIIIVFVAWGVSNSRKKQLRTDALTECKRKNPSFSNEQCEAEVDKKLPKINTGEKNE